MRKRKPTARLLALTLLLVVRVPLAGCARALDEPFSDEDAARLEADLDRRLADLSAQLARRPDDLALRSERGDVLFFRGRFREAADDYTAMIRIDPEQERGHWRRGIALYYAGDWGASARQFSNYHSFDAVDRENGIWRFLAQAKQRGVEQARAGLLEYDRPDRPPLEEIYQMFAGKKDPTELLAEIAAAEIGEGERAKRLFYAELYVGLYQDTLGRPAEARSHLHAAVENAWARRASGGPGFMWHVARVHAMRLDGEEK